MVRINKWQTSVLPSPEGLLLLVDRRRTQHLRRRYRRCLSRQRVRLNRPPLRQVLRQQQRSASRRATSPREWCHHQQWCQSRCVEGTFSLVGKYASYYRAGSLGRAVVQFACHRRNQQDFPHRTKHSCIDVALNDRCGLSLANKHKSSIPGTGAGILIVVSPVRLSVMPIEKSARAALLGPMNGMR